MRQNSQLTHSNPEEIGRIGRADAPAAGTPRSIRLAPAFLGGGCESLIQDFEGEITADEPEAVPAALKAIDDARAKGLSVAACLAYELGYCFEPRLLPLLPRARAVPLISAFTFDERRVRQDRDMIQRPAAPPKALAASLAARPYCEKIRRILDYIAAGDVYQVNFTYPSVFPYTDDLGALYRALLNHQSVPYHALLEFEGSAILSLSPELFFEIKDGIVRTRPMKGTAPRARLADADPAAADALAADPKNRAENLMIVDLLRNDLARITRAGSVRVARLFQVETYRTLHTMTSTVEGEVLPGTAPSQILKALFPCGSVTGAPKIRAMEIIRELETEPRGIYTGAIGVFRANGDALFNVAIRTLTFSAGIGRLGSGGGIVADSDVRAEYAETRLKMRYLTGISPYTEDQAPLALIETMLWQPGEGLRRRHLHLERIAKSAGYFAIPFDAATIARALDAVTQGLAEIAHRVRLELMADGTPLIRAAPLPPAAKTWRLALSPHPIDSSDIYRAHKTSRRGLYEAEFRRVSEAGLAEEILFLNETGTIAEGSRTNFFLKRDGIYLTPSLAAGALPGVLRQELIASGAAREAALTLTDILQAEELFIGNSLRGLIPARRAGDWPTQGPAA